MQVGARLNQLKDRPVFYASNALNERKRPITTLFCLGIQIEKKQRQNSWQRQT
jgi:hypothetical protein